jgi:hypothetical protein
MAVYSKPGDYANARYNTIPDEFHKAAEKYIDAVYVTAFGKDPETCWNTYTKPPLLGLFSQWKTVELWAQSKTKDEGDQWTQIVMYAERELKRLDAKLSSINKFSQTTEVDYSDPQRQGQPGTLFRV